MNERESKKRHILKLRASGGPAYEAFLKKKRARASRRYHGNPQRRARALIAAKARRMKNKYGMTLAQHEAMMGAQDYRCAICNVHSQILQVDHDHTTGKVRQALCSPCNRMLGLAKDSPDILAKGIEYLRRHTS